LSSGAKFFIFKHTFPQEKQRMGMIILAVLWMCEGKITVEKVLLACGVDFFSFLAGKTGDFFWSQSRSG
jgi:hypothetical protein